MNRIADDIDPKPELIGATVVLAMGLFIALLLFDGFTIQRLWFWFVAPTFHVPTPTLVACIGIEIILWVSTYQHVKRSRNDAMNAMLANAANTAMMLAAGYLMHVVWGPR